MKTINLYEYLGENGTILSPVHLENIYSAKKFQVIADQGKVLTKDNINAFKTIIIPASEINEWKEVDGYIDGTEIKIGLKNI